MRRRTGEVGRMGGRKEERTRGGEEERKRGVGGVEGRRR